MKYLFLISLLLSGCVVKIQDDEAREMLNKHAVVITALAEKINEKAPTVSPTAIPGK